ncbi:unnamed protein product [Spirodela intermedia]|uniref:Uncharacterized protein n=1 Tax=Spirodela intermedia TaxID=51605 RepID=A0A7I8JEB1_SPIIN|nr:unnamed protein product [Spirodela intermedia]CAA6668480.1 unnamed protein product [Spirodela intermedia]
MALKLQHQSLLPSRFELFLSSNLKSVLLFLVSLYGGKIVVPVEQPLEGEDISSRLVQSLHDAARSIELALTEYSSSVKSSWFSKAWIGVDKNAWTRTISYQAAIYCLLQAAVEISSRGDGRDRDANVFVQRSLMRLSVPLETMIRDELSAKQASAYEWFWTQQYPTVVASFVHLLEREPQFQAATTICWNGSSSSSSRVHDPSLLMLSLSCIAAVTKLGQTKVSCTQFFSGIPDVTGRLMNMLVDYVPFLLHFGPRAASCRVKNDQDVEEISFWVDLVQKQVQRAIDREKIWSRLTTSESIEVLEKDLAIFGFFIALGRSTKLFLSKNGFTDVDDQIESFISALYYPQLSSISSYQLYVEVVCEELDWLPFYHTNLIGYKQTQENKGQGGDLAQEVVPQILDSCSHWMKSFIKYSTWVENPSNIKAARFLSNGHSRLEECQRELGIRRIEVNENGGGESENSRPVTSSSIERELDSFDKALESVEEAINRLEELLQELHLSNSNHGKEHLKAACSDLERLRKLKKEAEFLEASFRAKAASLEETGNVSGSNLITNSSSNGKPQGFWSFLVRHSTRKNEAGSRTANADGGNRAGETADSGAAKPDADLNEIHRFELLRHELFELERRVQRSTDGSHIDEEISVEGREGVAVQKGAALEKRKEENILAKSIDKFKRASTDVWQGTQLLAIDVAAATELLKRGMSGDELTTKEKKAIQRTFTDLASVVPIGFLMLLPVTAVGHAAMLAAIQRYVPALIPSTYGPERLDLLRQLEKVKEMGPAEAPTDENAAEAMLPPS